MQDRGVQALASTLAGADSIRRTGLPGIRVEAPRLVPHPASRAAVDWLRELVGDLGSLPSTVDDAERIDQIAALEHIKAATAAAQATLISDFHDSQIAQQRAMGVSTRRLGGGIAEQVALARKVSPTTGQRQVAFARALVDEMPRTLELMQSGEVSEWVATLVVRETSALSRVDRSQVDSDLAAELATMSPREAEIAARRRSYAIDAESALRRSRTSRGDRRVSIRPAPDTMALVTGFVPVEQGVAAYASLNREARAAKSAGDERSLGQIMSDTFIERLTGQATASAVSAEIAITMTADALLAGDDIPAQIPGYGPLPAELARHIASGNAMAEASPASPFGREGDWWPNTPDSSGANEAAADSRHPSERCSECLRRDRADEGRARVFIRRVFTNPVNDTVVAVDPRRRLFPPSLSRLFQFRDQVCRVSYCTAPLRHDDHVVPHHGGGLTNAENGQGLCEHDNQVKELPGWRVTVLSGEHHRTLMTTPTGHTYESHAPPALGPGSSDALSARLATASA